MAKNFWLTTVEPYQTKTVLSDFMITSYDIKMIRSRKDNGNPYGPILMSNAEFVVKLEYNYGTKVLYERLNENAESYFAIRQDNNTILEMMAYVVDINEFYSPSTDGMRDVAQLQAKINLLVTEITYKGTEETNYRAIFG